MLANASEFGVTNRSVTHANRSGPYCGQSDNLLFRLAYSITGDEVQAQDSLIAAYDLAAHGEAPFRNWLLEWASRATVRSALEARLAEILECKDRYKSLDHERSRDRPRVMMPDLPELKESILLLGPERVIFGPHPLARAILVLRCVLRASVRDCSIQLNVSSESVLAIQRRITQWLKSMLRMPLSISERPA